MASTEDDSSRISTLLHLIDTLVGDVLAPLVACTGDLDGAARQLKTGVIRRVRDAGVPPEIAGHHLGRCERSIYRHLETQSRPEETKRPMRELLTFIERRGGTAGDCVRHLQKQYPSLTSSTVIGMLDAQVALVLIRRVTEETARTRSERYEAPVASDRGAPRALLRKPVSADVMADIHAYVLARLNITGVDAQGMHAENVVLMLSSQGLLAWLAPVTRGGHHEP